MPRRSATRKQVDLGFLGNPSAGTDLSAMFAESVSTPTQVTPVRIDRLMDNPYQPRQLVDPAGVAELARVIRAQGFQGVLVARPQPENPGYYQLTAGHRRRDAAAEAGLTTLPVIVRELADEEMIVLAIVENIQREDLTTLEEGRIFLLMDQELGYTHDQIAREVGKTRGYVENRIRVARSPADVQELVREKPDSLRAVSTLIKVKDEVRRADAIRQLRSGTITTDDLPGYLDAQNGGPTSASSVPTAPTVSVKAQAELAAATAAEQQHESQQALGPAAQLAPSSEHEQSRIGTGKLSNALRSLRSYRDSIKDREDLSAQELVMVSRIREMIDDIHTLLAPKVED